MLNATKTSHSHLSFFFSFEKFLLFLIYFSFSIFYSIFPFYFIFFYNKPSLLVDHIYTHGIMKLLLYFLWKTFLHLSVLRFFFFFYFHQPPKKTNFFFFCLYQFLTTNKSDFYMSLYPHSQIFPTQKMHNPSSVISHTNAELVTFYI